MDNQQFDVMIVGGGPAGSSAGIALAQRGYSVALVEKQESIKDKICGEFFSPECIAYLNELGVTPDFYSNYPTEINTVTVTLNGSQVSRMLNHTAYGLSRIRFDAMLLEAARENGVTVLRGYEATGVDDHNGKVKLFVSDKYTGERYVYKPALIVAATGAKSGTESLFADQRMISANAHNVAFKFHADIPDLRNTVELYFTPFGYLGIGTIENDRVNICGLIDVKTVREQNGNIDDVLLEMSTYNEHLGNRLEVIDNETEYISCSNLMFDMRNPKFDNVICIGDTAGSIHPYCGDGIAMALRSGIMCAGVIDNIMRNKQIHDGAAECFQRVWRNEFKNRIAVGNFAHRLMSGRSTRHVAERFIGWYPRIIDLIFKHTRELKV